MQILQIGCDAVYAPDYQVSRPYGAPGYLLLLPAAPMQLQIGTAQYRAEADSMILLDRQTPHRIEAQNEPLRCDWLHFDTDRDQEFLCSLGIPFGTVLRFGDTATIRMLLHELCAAYYGESAKRPELLDSLLKALLIKTSQTLTVPMEQSADPHYAVMLRLHEAIYRNPQEKWSVEILAGMANMSRSYFQLLYRETFGTTCISDVISCKMNHAKELLTSTDHTISRIAAACGYDNEEHFMRMFKKNIGVTPTIYRREARKG